MKTAILFLALASCSYPVLAQNPVPTPATQIKLALLAAPEDKKDGATVYGYSPEKELVLLGKAPASLSVSVTTLHNPVCPWLVTIVTCKHLCSGAGN